MRKYLRVIKKSETRHRTKEIVFALAKQKKPMPLLSGFSPCELIRLQKVYQAGLSY